MQFTKDTQDRWGIRLVDDDGNGATGVLPADITDGTTSGNVTVIKSDGTTASIALVNNTNWFEISASKAPGFYQVVVPAAATDVVGGIFLSVKPSGSTFRHAVFTGHVRYMFHMDYEPFTTEPVQLQLVRSIDARIIEIIFNQRVNQEEAENVANYEVSPALTIFRSVKVSDLHYRLVTSQQVIDQVYEVTATNINGAGI